MNFFPRLFGHKPSVDDIGDDVVPEEVDDRKFISEHTYQEKKSQMINVVSDSWDQIVELSSDLDGEINLEYIFITSTDQKAQKLANELSELGYDSTFGIIEDSDFFGIVGHTPSMKLSKDTALAWVSDMCDRAYKHDCVLESWTIPSEQDVDLNT